MNPLDWWRSFVRALRSPLGRRRKDTAGGRIMGVGGQDVLLDEAEPTPGTSDATAFYTAVCGKSMKELLAEFGMTNIGGANGPGSPTGAPGQLNRFVEFRRLGYLWKQTSGKQVFIRPGRYPYHDGGSAETVVDAGTGPGAELMRPHATVVFTVREAMSPYHRKRMTVHFYGDGKVRAKGYVWNRQRPDRPTHYDGEDIRDIVEEQARGWSKRIHWCKSSEKG